MRVTSCGRCTSQRIERAEENNGDRSPLCRGGCKHCVSIRCRRRGKVASPGEFYMSGAKQASKRKHQSKAVPVLGAAGLSWTLASEVSLATTAPALDTMTRNAGVSYEIILREEEIFDVSLATF